MFDDFTSLEDYGIVGNQETSALVGRDGSVDLLSVPYLDSPTVFAALLDRQRGGTFSVTPLLKFQSRQRYLPNTNVLVTGFATATGEASLTDFMPPLEAGVEHRMLLRRVRAERHDCTLRVLFRPKFDYGRRNAKMRREGGAILAFNGKLSLRLTGEDFALRDDEAEALLSLHEGESVWLALCWGDAQPPAPEQCERLLKAATDFWTAWSGAHRRSESVLRELYDYLAIRSGLALKLLLNPRTGGIAAAGSFALPECVGGIRNWDYRFAWLRDASFTAQALFHLGYSREAAAYRQWLLALLREIKDLSEVRPLYPLHPDAKIEEGPVEALGGYRHSAPVRIGNLAAHQSQLDVYGELVNAVFEMERYGEEIEQPVWATVEKICDYICENWGKKDRGIWEMRTAPRDYVHSKLMCWVALDRGALLAGRTGRRTAVDRWCACADEIRRAILERGFSERLNSFVQSFQDEELDAATLLIPIHGFLPPDDPRVQGTIDAVLKGLSAGNGLFYRYRADDGLAGRQGAFILCSFWLISALAVSRRTEEAQVIFERVLEHASPLGLFSEEVDPSDGRLIGNFPQALSHIGLINAALHLGIAKGHGHEGPPPHSEGERRL